MEQDCPTVAVNEEASLWVDLETVGRVARIWETCAVLFWPLEVWRSPIRRAGRRLLLLFNMAAERVRQSVLLAVRSSDQFVEGLLVGEIKLFFVLSNRHKFQL